LMDDKVWSKAIEDTAGLKEFFHQHNANYVWNSRAQATIYNVNNKETLDKLKQELLKDKYPVKEPKVSSILFTHNQTVLSDELKKKIDLAIPPLVKDKSLILEIKGGREFKESNAISLLRADSVKAYLVARGIAENRIITSDLGKAPIRKTSEERDSDRKVSFAFYSTSKKTLESPFNEKTALSLQVTEGLFQKGEQPALDSTDWKPGNYTIEKEGRINYVVINKIEAPRNKTFEEARGLAISDYQSYLEKEWIAALKKKYPVIIYNEELQKLVKK
ncbi:MAG TPA: hypothetical protein VK766_11355, partial [Cytophagaceae bacterium]|nr:hypothetical protein [Cytophagaceae bacterium]